MSSFKAKKQAREQRSSIAGPSKLIPNEQVVKPVQSQSAASPAPSPISPPQTLAENVNLQLRHTLKRGRGVYWNDTQTCSRGTTLLQLEPHVSSLSSSHLSTHCYSCFASSPNALQRCSGCRVLRYCSVTCQRSDWQLHRTECAALKAYAAKVKGAEHQVVEPGTSIRALARLLWMREHLKQEWWAQIKAMQSHRSSMSQDQLRPHAELAFNLSQYLSLASPTAMSNAEILRRLGFETPAQLLDLVCSMATNAFTAAASDLSPLGVSVAPTVALINHSCRPNAVVVFPQGPKSSTVKEGQRSMHLVAICDIKPGEEILTAYVDLSDSFARRQSVLPQGYFFTCACPACTSINKVHIEWIDPREAVWCPRQECDGWLWQPCVRQEEVRKCNICQSPSSMSCEEYRALVAMGEEALKAEQVAPDPATAWSTIQGAISRLSAYLPPSSYPLLSLIRAGQTSLIGAATDASGPLESAAMLEEATRLGLAAVAAMQSGSGVVYAAGHPARAVAMATLGKLLLLDPPRNVNGQVSSAPAPIGSALVRPTFYVPPYGTQRVMLAKQVLVQALQELSIGFGQHGGEVGRQTREMLLDLEREFAQR